MNESEDAVAGFLVFSWIFFVIVSAHLVVGVPYYLAGPYSLISNSRAIYIASGTILALLCAVGFTGYLLRILPPPAIGSPAVTYLSSLLVCTVSLLAFPLADWVWEGKWKLGLPFGLYFWVAWLLYLWWNTARERNLRRPFVLFLRRFGSFADLAALRSVLAEAPRGCPVVMLAGEAEDSVGAWDPTSLIAFGFRATIPLAGRPIFLQGDESWKQAVESLIDRSAAVVIDPTGMDESESLRWEMRVIAQSKPAVPVIQLISDQAEEVRPPSMPQGYEGQTITIRYSRGRLALVRGMGLTVVIVGVVGYVANIVQQLSDAAAEGKLAGAIFGAFIMLGGLSVFLLGLTLRRSLSQQAKREIADAFETVLPSGETRKTQTRNYRD